LQKKKKKKKNIPLICIKLGLRHFKEPHYSSRLADGSALQFTHSNIVMRSGVRSKVRG
jgi:hypothetical protein